MSDYHVLEGGQGGDGTDYTVVFHFPVPDEDNAAGVNLQTARSQDPEVKTSLVPGLVQAEQNALDNGSLIEVVQSYSRNPANSLAADQAALDGMWTAGAAKAATALRNKYKFWGYSRSL